MLAGSTFDAIEDVKQDVADLKTKFGLPDDLAIDLRDAVNAQVKYVAGGKKSNAYQTISNRIFSAAWHDLKSYFKVTKYRKIPVERFDEAMNYANNWTPDTNLRIDIERANAQIELEV